MKMRARCMAGAMTLLALAAGCDLFNGTDDNSDGNETPPVNQQPEFVQDSPAVIYLVDEGDLLAIPLTAVDPDDDSVAYSLGSNNLPRPATITITASSLTWQSKSGDEGVYRVVVAAGDGKGGTAEARVDIIVSSLTPPSSGAKLIAPNGGEVYHVGDTILIAWRIDPQKVTNALYVDFSPDSGVTYGPLFPNPNLGPKPQDTSFYTGTTALYRWTITGSVEDLGGTGNVATVSDSCIFKLEEAYSLGDPPYGDMSDGVFSVKAAQ